jgi:hypothetical protein
VLHHEGGHSYTLRQLRDSVKLIAWSSQFASPVLVPFVVVGLFSRRHRRVVVALTLFCGFVVLAWWLATHRVDRFLLPILPLAALVAGVGATWSRGVGWQRGVRVLVTVGAVYALFLNVTRFNSDNRFLVALDDLRIDAPNPHDPDYFQNHTSHQYLNEVVRDGYCVLAVGDAQAFDFSVPVLYNTCFDDCQFEQLLRGRTREERYAALRERRISHLFVYWSEIDRYRSPGNYGYSDFVTRDLVRRVLVREQQLLQPVPLNDNPENSEVFEVVGWRDW